MVELSRKGHHSLGVFIQRDPDFPLSCRLSSLWVKELELHTALGLFMRLYTWFSEVINKRDYTVPDTYMHIYTEAIPSQIA